MRKTFDCTGEKLDSLNVQGALIFIESMLQGLRGGNVPFIAEYSKDDEGTTLTLRTLRTLRDVPKAKLEPMLEPAAEVTVQPARRGRKSKSVEVVSAESVESEGQVNEQVEATGVT